MTLAPTEAARGPRRSTPRPVPLASVQGTLALDLRQSWEAPPPVPVHPSETVCTDAGGPVVVAPRGQAADVEEVAGRFAQALIEVLGGDRGSAQLLRWATPEVYVGLQRRAALLARTVPADRRVRRLRSRVRSVHVCQPRPGILEVAIHLRRGERSHAVAARLEHRLERRRGQLRAAWVCTDLEVG